MLWILGLKLHLSNIWPCPHMALFSLCVCLCVSLFKRSQSYWIVCVPSHFSRVPLFAVPWTDQAPLSMAFFRQECWSGLPCPPPGDLLNPGVESNLWSFCIGRWVLTTSRQLWSPYCFRNCPNNFILMTSSEILIPKKVVSNSLWPHWLYSPWTSLGQNTGVGSLSLL